MHETWMHFESCHGLVMHTAFLSSYMAVLHLLMHQSRESVLQLVDPQHYPKQLAKHKSRPCRCLLKANVISAAQSAAVQDFEAEYERFQAGAYNESLQQWLLGSWQGDALQASTCPDVAADQIVVMPSSTVTQCYCHTSCPVLLLLGQVQPYSTVSVACCTCAGSNLSTQLFAFVGHCSRASEQL